MISGSWVDRLTWQPRSVPQEAIYRGFLPQRGIIHSIPTTVAFSANKSGTNSCGTSRRSPIAAAVQRLGSIAPIDRGWPRGPIGLRPSRPRPHGITALAGDRRAAPFPAAQQSHSVGTVPGRFREFGWRQPFSQQRIRQLAGEAALARTRHMQPIRPDHGSRRKLTRSVPLLHDLEPPERPTLAR